jgi:thiamine kinase-like enzyme
MDFVYQILKINFPTIEWKVYKPKKGKSKESYIAESTDKKVFIKFDAKTKVLDILSSLRIAPKVLIEDTYDGRHYFIQEFVEGFHPDADWINNNLKELAAIIIKYHSNSELKATLSKSQDINYQTHITKEIHELKKSYIESSSEIIRNLDTREILDLLLEYSNKLHEVELVPTHLDTNHSNFIIADKHIFIVDWDDVILSDEMRDISLFTWLYVKKDKWSDFMKYLSIDFNNSAQMRFYWWLAQGLLSISFWFEKRHDVENIEIYLNQAKQTLEKLKLIV